MSSGKSGSGEKSKNIYGTILGAVGWGPIDWLRGIVSNGNYVFQGSLTITSDVTDLTSSLVDPTMIMQGGWLKLYRGTSTQPAPSAMSGHCNYKDTILIEAKHLFFGQDSGTPPNIQIIGGRLPRVPTTIVAAADNVVDDDQINPIAFLAEALLDARGLGFPVSDLDAASWLAAAHWCYTNRAATFVSPLVNEQLSFRDLAKRILEPFDGMLYWTSQRKLACRIYEWGVDPGGLLTLDERHAAKVLKFTHGDWKDIKTQLTVTFTDRAYEFQSNTAIVPNAYAQKIRQVDDPDSLDRKDIMRASQAFLQGANWHRRKGSAPGSGTLEIGEAFASSLTVGDKIKANIDPQPGGAGLAQLCRVKRIRRDRSDSVQIDVMTDSLAPAAPYTPVWADPTVDDAVCGTLTHMLALPLPLSFASPHSVGFCVSRPTGDMLGFSVYFSTDPAQPFHMLGDQIGFAVRAQLAAGITSGATTANITELDGASAPDANLAANTPGGNGTQAQDDSLLAIFVALDGSGRVQMDGSGLPIMEWASVVSRSPVSGDTYAYTLLRGRQSTTAQAWTTGAAVWLIPKINLEAWHHELIPQMGGQTLYFRLQVFNHLADDISSPLPDADLVMPTPIPPTASLSTDGVAPYFIPGTRRYTLGTAIRITYSDTPSLAYFETKVTATDSDAATDYAWSVPSGLRTRSKTVLAYDPSGTGRPGYVRIRAVDIYGIASAWVRIGNANTAMSIGTGDIAAQDANDVKSSGMTLAQGGAASTKYLSEKTEDGTWVTTAAAVEQRFYASLSGFSFKPHGIKGTNISNVGYNMRYDWDDAGNSSTQAALVITDPSGASIPAGTPFRYSATFYARA